MTKNKAYYFELGQIAAVNGNTCKYKVGGWQRTAWQAGYDSVRMTAKALAEVEAKKAKLHMAACHPDHGGTCEAFRNAHREWKRREAYARSL